jgi:hypothetical protein
MGGPLFKRIDCDVEYIISAIDQGTIGLPDIQRPFVWPSTKVRDLFDSMMKGYPVGYILLWAAPEVEEGRQIGTEGHGTDRPSTLIIDGQQRLTSLYAVMKGKQVLDKNFQKKSIAISFRPTTGEFEVSTIAHQRDPEWIEDISKIFMKSESAYTVTSNFIKHISAHRELPSEEQGNIEKNIEKLLHLKKYPFSALEINSFTDEEDVADIFVRVNSQGQSLKQADFILTLMSVFWEEGRKALADFSETSRKPDIKGVSSYNYFIEPDPEQMLRVTIGYGFKRARLKYAYLILRGKDLETGQFSPELRDNQFDRLKEAQKVVLDFQNWHEFLKSLLAAGYRSSAMITSQTAILYAYVFYLIGKKEFKIDAFKLRIIIAQWFFMSYLTQRYSSSPESRMEQDLANIRTIKTGDQYIQHLKDTISSELTNDFWSITLPSNLSTSAARSPAWFAYCAALNLKDVPVLFSNVKVSELLDPITNAKKSALERHHLFPKNYLQSIGVADDRDRNQIANFALVEWTDNIDISDTAPKDYLQSYLDRFPENEIENLYEWHALPKDWQNMDYTKFLQQRRQLMSNVIREGFQSIEKTKY